MRILASFALRDMCESDLRWVWRARNSVEVRRNSNSDRIILFNQHVHWFNSTSHLLKLVFTENGRSRGVILYDRESHIWSFYLKPDCPKHDGLGRVMLSLFIAVAKRLKFKKIIGIIQLANTASTFLHLDLGFKMKLSDNHWYGVKEL
jgi:hypothetical protein